MNPYKRALTAMGEFLDEATPYVIFALAGTLAADERYSAAVFVLVLAINAVFQRNKI